ncbi:hypothetical protein, partial [Desulfobacula sp.]|uniref:hypothetical protein n=1 Tax=Desulfobacula sp. TaxID=2593537 RepID=UPI0039B853DD
ESVELVTTKIHAHQPLFFIWIHCVYNIRHVYIPLQQVSSVGTCFSGNQCHSLIQCVEIVTLCCSVINEGVDFARQPFHNRNYFKASAAVE